MKSTKSPVRLRERETKTGNKSLYLDIYWKGKRRYEYLNLYLIPEKSRMDKETNRQTMQLAEAICAKRLVEFRNGKYGFEDTDRSRKTLLADYFEYAMSQRKPATREAWHSTLAHLRNYGIAATTLDQVDVEFIEGFKRHLEKTDRIVGDHRMAKNTINIYYNVFQACLNQAYREGILKEKITDRVDKPKAEATQRQYLTIEELKLIADTPMKNDVLRRAFIFGCLTGLRKSDIQNLKWKDVTQNGEFIRLTFVQKKTGRPEYYDITEQAASIMGERRDPDSQVFDGLTGERSLSNRLITQWAKSAGIDKHITFHSSRHTFATIMLNQGVDIFTVSKLLGHASVSTTQIYAKLIDKSKQEAVKKYPKIDI